LHSWDVDTQEAIEIQRSLASRVSVKDGLVSSPRYAVGVDISPPDVDGIAVGAAVLLELPELQIVDVSLPGKAGLSVRSGVTVIS